MHSARDIGIFWFLLEISLPLSLDEGQREQHSQLNNPLRASHPLHYYCEIIFSVHNKKGKGWPIKEAVHTTVLLTLQDTAFLNEPMIVVVAVCNAFIVFVVVSDRWMTRAETAIS